MKAIRTDKSNDTLKAPPDSENVYDLPITRIVFEDGVNAVESCWEISPEEMEIILKTKKIYFTCFGVTHPPIILKAESFIDIE
jgi:hypothetical protein